MARMSFGPSRRSRRETKPSQENTKSIKEIVEDIRAGLPPSKENYRERSLALHGLICARCGREFPPAQRQLLTVHHKDGNHLNNPPDGSNWENLCAYCHEDIHSRELLGEYLDNDK
ncbi:MAG: YajD family HNH nuclease [Thermodesulfobacteriota bacterium]